jgi:ribonuclease HI
MKKKEQLNKALALLRDFLGGDKEVDQSLKLLEEKVLEIEFNEEILPGGDLPLPQEFSHEEADFALFSDGACRGNPGPGAWAAIGQDERGDVLFETQGVEVTTTNNKMELEAAIKALHEIKNYILENGDSIESKILLFSDSKYVVDGASSWMANWKRRGWKKGDNKEPENLELWKRMDAILVEFPNMKFLWVKGHAGHPQNERCDRLANEILDDSGF